MEVFNNVIPYNLDMNWVKNDTFTFLDNTIVLWLSKACGEGLDLSFYDGEISIKYTKKGEVLQTISTSNSEMIFTNNEISFDKPDLTLKDGVYFYQLKLTNKIDNTIVGTLLSGEFNVLN